LYLALYIGGILTVTILIQPAKAYGLCGTLSSAAEATLTGIDLCGGGSAFVLGKVFVRAGIDAFKTFKTKLSVPFVNEHNNSPPVCRFKVK
jgi:hypothetical protein